MTQGAAWPTTYEWRTGVLVAPTSLSQRGVTRRRWESQLRQDACSPGESRLDLLTKSLVQSLQGTSQRTTLRIARRCPIAWELPVSVLNPIEASGVLRCLASTTRGAIVSARGSK